MRSHLHNGRVNIAPRRHPSMSMSQSFHITLLNRILGRRSVRDRSRRMRFVFGQMLTTFNKEQQACFIKTIPKSDGNKSAVRRTETVKRILSGTPKMLAPMNSCSAVIQRGHLSTPNEVARKITKYSYPETDFQLPPRGQAWVVRYLLPLQRRREPSSSGFAEQGWELVRLCHRNYFKTFYFKRELELIPDTTNAD